MIYILFLVDLGFIYYIYIYFLYLRCDSWEFNFPGKLPLIGMAHPFLPSVILTLSHYFSQSNNAALRSIILD